MNFFLTVITGLSVGAGAPVDTTPVHVGRGFGNELVVDDDRVSRRHARITTTDDGALLEDLGSRNGTALNGERITSPAPLKVGDEITVGQTQLALVELPAHLANAGGDDECRRARALIGWMVDGELGADAVERLNAHLAHCDSCRAAESTTRDFHGALAEALAVEVPEQFTQTVRVQLPESTDR